MIADRVGPQTGGLELRADIDVNGADIEPLWKEHGIPEVAILQDFTNYFDKHHGENDTPKDVDLNGLGRTTFLLIRLVQVISSGAGTRCVGLHCLGNVEADLDATTACYRSVDLVGLAN